MDSGNNIKWKYAKNLNINISFSVPDFLMLENSVEYRTGEGLPEALKNEENYNLCQGNKEYVWV